MNKLRLVLLLGLCLMLCGCAKFGSEDIKGVKSINIDQIFEIDESEYYIFFYKDDCDFCDEVKPLIEEYMKTNPEVKIYGVNFSKDKNKLINREYLNGEGSTNKYHVSGVTKYEDLYISGYPSLIKIENKVSSLSANGRMLTTLYLEQLLGETNE